MFKYLRQLGFGLNIDSSGVSAVKIVEKGRRLVLTGSGSASLPAGLIRSGQIQDEGTVSEIIRRAVAGARPHKIKDVFVNLSLPEQISFLQVVQLPQMAAEEVGEAIKWEIEANIPLSIDTVYYDWQILPTPMTRKKIDHRDVLIIAAPKYIVDAYVKVTKRAGFCPKSVEIDSLPLSRILIPKGSSRDPVLIVELSSNLATVVIFSGSAPRFSSSIPLSSRYFSEMAVPGPAAEGQAKAGGPVPPTAAAGQTKAGAEEESSAFINFLVEQIRSYVEFYEDHAEHEHREEAVKVGKILLCGSGIFSGLEKTLSQKLNIRVEIANPFANLSKNPKDDFASMSYEEALASTKALGAASREFLSFDD